MSGQETTNGVSALTLLSGQWLPSRLRFPLLLLLPLLVLGPALVPGARLLPLPPVTQEPLASEHPEEAARLARGAHRVATDGSFLFLDEELEVRRQLEQGVLPTWDPRHGLGQPLAAGSLVTPWNPLRWPFLWLPPDLASGWHALLSMVLAGLGALLFLEGRGLKFTAALLGALAFQGSGFVVANLGYVMKLDALLWAPWCLWGVDLLYRGRRNAGLLVVAGLGLSAVAGFPQVFVMVAALVLAWTLVRALEAIRHEHESAFWRRSLATALALFALGLLAGGVQLLPTAEVVQHSSRGPQAPASVAAQHLPLAATLTMVLPDAFGTPDSTSPASSEPATWWLLDADEADQGLAANRLEWHLFAGLTTLAFVAAALLSRPRDSAFPLLVLLAASGLALGLPGLSFLYGLPGTNLGAPARAWAVAGLALAWLAALGMDALLEGWRPARLGAMGVAAAGLVGGLTLHLGLEPAAFAEDLEATLPGRFGVDLETLRGFFSSDDARRTAERLSAAGQRLALVGAALLPIAYLVGRLTVRRAGLAACALLAVELVLGGRPQTPVLHPGELPLFPPSRDLDALARAAGEGRILRVDTSADGVGEVLQLARPNLPAAYGIADLTPYTAFPSLRLTELWEALDPEGLYRGAPARISDPTLLEHPLLDALRVTAVLSTGPIASPVLEEVHSREGFRVHARRGDLGLARVVPRLVEAGGDAPLELASATHDFAAAALGPRAEILARREDFRAGQLEWSRPAPDRIDISVRGTSGGFLVVHEGWMPGWKATVDGLDAEVLRLDHAFLGLELPPGDPLVRLKYEPWSQRLGLLCTLVGLAGALLITRGRHLRPRPPGQPLPGASPGPR